MYKIVEAREIGFKIKQFVIEAPRIARKQKPGQFIIVRLHENGERIPLTIKSLRPGGRDDYHLRAIDRQNHFAAELPGGGRCDSGHRGPAGPSLGDRKLRHGCDSVGQRGHGDGAAYGHALKQAGNHVIFIEGARNTEMVVFEEEVRAGQRRDLHHDR